MKVELRLYKTFDADLIALNSNGISVASLMDKALRYYVKGVMLNFYVPECRPYDLEGKRRSIHLAIDVTDEDCVAFLKEELKPRQRAAFLKTLVRGCLMYPNLGVYLRHGAMIDEENKRIQALDLDNAKNLDVLSFEGKKKRRTADEILKPAGAPKKEGAVRGTGRTDVERFGKVADLAYIGGKPTEAAAGKTSIEKIVEERAEAKKKEEKKEELVASYEYISESQDDLFNQFDMLRSG